MRAPDAEHGIIGVIGDQGNARFQSAIGMGKPREARLERDHEQRD